MEILYQIFLISHIISGHVALILGAYLMATTKGNSRHRMLGKLFYYAMLVISISAIYISVTKSLSHLLHIGIFAFYQNYAGRRAIQEKSLKLNFPDWIVWSVAAINGVAMVLTMNIVLMVFGGISLSLTVGSLVNGVKVINGQTISPKAWLSQHIGYMVGAYISTITAFIVVNISTAGIWWILWLLPTIILVPLIVFWTRKYARNPIKAIA
jgi:hypothetical protein